MLTQDKEQGQHKNNVIKELSKLISSCYLKYNPRIKYSDFINHLHPRSFEQEFIVSWDLTSLGFLAKGADMEFAGPFAITVRLHRNQLLTYNNNSFKGGCNALVIHHRAKCFKPIHYKKN